MTNPLLHFLEENRFKEGDQLPPERKLSERLGISRRSLRQQLLALELDGRLWRGVGRGTFLGSKPTRSLGSLGATADDLSPHTVLDARLMFEPITVAMAALRATPQDLSAIENCVRKNAEATDNESWSRWDGAFHRAIAKSTRNPVALVVAETLIAARQMGAWDSMRKVRVDSHLRDQSAGDHRLILAALKCRDAEAAAAAMKAHLHHVAHMLTINISV